MCFDGTKRLCHIRGKLRKKVWINQSDIILRYSPDEARSLKAYGELPESAKINETNFDEEYEDDIDFAEMSEEEDAIDDI